MRSTLGPAGRVGNVGTPELCSEAARELGARAYAELRVHAREVTLHRALREEQRRRDLSVRPTSRHELRHAALGRRQLKAAGATADGAELVPGSLGPPLGAEVVKHRDGSLDRVARGALLARAATDDPEREQRPRASKRLADGLMTRGRVGEQLLGEGDITARGGDEPTTPRRVREHPLATGTTSGCLPVVEPGDRI